MISLFTTVFFRHGIGFTCDKLFKIHEYFLTLVILHIPNSWIGAYLIIDHILLSVFRNFNKLNKLAKIC